VARETRQRGWWQPYGSVLTSAFIGFEADAETDPVVRGAMRAGPAADRGLRAGGPDGAAQEATDQIDNRVRIRMVRRELLTHDDPVDLWCVLDEAALLRPVGGRKIMQRQLEHLAKMAELPNVRLQILPLEIGATLVWKAPLFC
jgi:hypothetical protein